MGLTRPMETKDTPAGTMTDASAATPLISILMNCYNGEKFLVEAIESVLAQTYRNWELIFWDNRSTDRSAEIAQSYNDDRIRYFLAPEHTNLAPARGRAVAQARGKYICFLDCDDSYLPENLETKVSWLERSGAAAAYGGVIYIDEAGVEHRRKMLAQKDGNLFESLLRQFDADISTLTVSRPLMDRLGINFSDDIVGSTEYDLLMQLAATERCITIPAYLARLRVHPNSLTSSLIGDWATDRNRTLRRVRQRVPDIIGRYKEAFAEAYARADYYHTRWLVAQGRRIEALACLHAIASHGWRYRALYWALRISTSCWQWVHRHLPSARRL